jgi:DNA-binding LacI/PurR family transcriptional regulator
MDKSRPSMKDVAAAAGVGKSTVSLALRDDPRLKPETCQRIQKIAQKLGYQANPTVAHLMAQLRISRSPDYQGTLAMLNAAGDPSLLTTDPTYSQWVKGCQERAGQLGYKVDTFWLHDPEVPPAKLRKILYARNIRGVILAAFTGAEEIPSEFFWENFSSVCIGMHLPRPDLHFASNDQFSTVQMAVQKLLDRGYRRPGLVLDPARDAVIEYRFSGGFWVAQKSIPSKDRVPQLELKKPDIRHFETWLKKHRPDVIVTIHVEVREWLKKLGYQVPGDIGLIHLDLTDSKEHANWAGMDQKNDEVGAAAVDLLVAQIYRSESGIPEFSRSLQVESRWVDGKTVRKAK